MNEFYTSVEDMCVNSCADVVVEDGVEVVADERRKMCTSYCGFGQGIMKNHETMDDGTEETYITCSDCP